jgi:hypothetical protein
MLRKIDQCGLESRCNEYACWSRCHAHGQTPLRLPHTLGSLSVYVSDIVGVLLNSISVDIQALPWLIPH